MMERLETAILCDAMHALGYEPKILDGSFQSNISQARIIGRARTINLKPLDESDPPKKLYDGLYLLDEINNGDIVIVANGFKDCAYFGELMSTFAKRNGAVGAIVDGITRDKNATTQLGFPVFAKGWLGRDLRDRGTVESTDKTVTIGKIAISKGDLVCADGDGIIVIPNSIEKEVLQKAYEIITTEIKVKELLKKGKTARQLMKECGEF